MAPGAALGKVARKANQGLEHLEKFESLYNEEAMGLHDSGFLLGKGKGKSFGKGGPGKSKPNKPRLLALQDGEVDPPTEDPQPPSEEQILAQTRKQASKAEAMVHKLQSWTKLWKRKEADHSTGPPCCLEKGRGPAAGQLEEGVLAARGSSSLGKGS